MSLLSEEPHSSTVRAELDGEVLLLARDRFFDLLTAEPALARAIIATLIRRLRLANAQRLATLLPADAADDFDLVSASPLRDPPMTHGPRTATADHHGRWPRWLWQPNRRLLGLALAGAALLAGWAVPPPPGLTPTGWRALASLVAVVPLLGLSGLPDGVVAFAVVAVWVLAGVATPTAALAGFASTSWVLTVSILAVGAAAAGSGLVYRSALWAVEHARGGFASQVLALALSGFVIGAAVPNAAGRVSMIAPVMREIIETLGYKPGTRPAAGLAMAVHVGYVAGFLTSSTVALLVYGVLPRSARGGLNWGTWAVQPAPTHVVLFLGLVAAIAWWYRPRPDARPRAGPLAARSDGLALRWALLGPPSRHERIAMGVVILLILGLATEPLHGLDPAWIGVLALVVLAATGVLRAESLGAVNWNFALLFGMMLGMAGVLTNAKVDSWLAALAGDTLGRLASMECCSWQR
jgi:DASS family divalent anion:Na+ symporter